MRVTNTTYSSSHPGSWYPQSTALQAHLVIHIPQPILDDAILRHLVAVPEPCPGPGEVVGDAGHALHPSSHHDLCGADRQALACHHDSLHA